MKTKHTHGTWYSNTTNKHLISADNGETHAWQHKNICQVYGENHEERAANAKLIASAPELLEALKYVKQRIEDSEEWWMDSPNRGGFDMEIIEIAIKKATE